MKISDLQNALEDFKNNFGDVELEYWIIGDDIEEELIFEEIHEGYNTFGPGVKTVCEIRMNWGK